MEHVLIIGGDRDWGAVIEDSLWESGYHSIIHAFDEQDARAVLTCIRPALIVLLAESSPTVSADDLYGMSDGGNIPVIVATDNAAKTQNRLGDGASLSGPYPVKRMGNALVAASEPSHRFVAAA